MLTLVPLAWRNLTHDKRRFAVSVMGIGFAVLLMFVELGFWNAMLDAAVSLLAQCKGDLVIVSKAYLHVGHSRIFFDAAARASAWRARRRGRGAAVFRDDPVTVARLGKSRL